MFVFKAVFVRGLLEKAERLSFLVGKLCDLLKTELLITCKHWCGSAATGAVCMPTSVVVTFLTAKGSAEELWPLTLLCKALHKW